MGNRRNSRPRSRRARKQNTSPYHRYGKAPFRYSAAYYEWRRQFVRDKPIKKAA